jgi:chromosome segregation ATPase
MDLGTVAVIAAGVTYIITTIVGAIRKGNSDVDEQLRKAKDELAKAKGEEIDVLTRRIERLEAEGRDKDGKIADLSHGNAELLKQVDSMRGLLSGEKLQAGLKAAFDTLTNEMRKLYAANDRNLNAYDRDGLPAPDRRTSRDHRADPRPSR